MTKKMPGVLLDILGKESLYCLPQSSIKDTTEEEEAEVDDVSVPPPTETCKEQYLSMLIACLCYFAEFQSFLQFGLLAQKRLTLLLTTRNPTGNEKKPL
jgi:hypothetical protein